MKLYIFCSFRFEGFHVWPGAPTEYAYLGSRHRHEFHIKAWVRTSSYREVEFINLKQMMLEQCMMTAKTPEVVNWSCEEWAKYLVDQFGLSRVEVSEDGENGAYLEFK